MCVYLMLYLCELSHVLITRVTFLRSMEQGVPELYLEMFHAIVMFDLEYSSK